ncbi:exported hypothetical protein [Candidatus Sulfopaludibacter sp. SbA4]|nr:exported hypothetical protein [Candidatus Sulfopaludibacter sp. SbA4]
MRILLLVCAALTAFAQSHLTWSDYAGAADSAQYSALDQVKRANVSKLEVAWTYPIGDGRKYSFNPVVVDGVMYVLAKNNSIVALNAATGKEVWTYAPDPPPSIITYRGINYWESPDRSERRLLFSANHALRAIDARTGKPIPSFGSGGSVELKEGLGRDPKALRLVQSTTPGRVFENLLILGSATNEGYGSAPGDLRAFDVRTGKLVWTFHTIPHPGEFGYDTWPNDAWKTVGGANVWGEFSLDEKRGILYAPTASPKYNFFGADRTGANLFGDCLLALDARTGKRLWHFQMVHHDIWDYDDATAPKLLTVVHEGKRVDAVAQLSKQGFVWVFNRVTGEPLFPIEERPVPRTDVPGEETWPTQPFPLKPPPFARQKFTADDLNQFITDPQERSRFRDQILSARNEGLFTPLHAACPARHRRDAGQQRGSQLGRRRGRSGPRPALRGVEGSPCDPPTGARQHRARGRGPLHQRLRPHHGAQRPLSDRATLVFAHGLRFERRDHPLEDSTGRGARPRGEGRQRYRHALPEGRTGGDCRRPDLHRNARPQGARARRGQRQAALGAARGCGDGGHSRRLPDRRPRIHRLLRRGPGGPDAVDTGENPGSLCRLRAAR